MKSTWKNISRKCEMWKTENIWKQGNITIQTCKSLRHGKCNSPKWKAQIWKLGMGNFKAGNILKPGNVLESLRHGKSRNFKTKLQIWKQEMRNLWKCLPQKDWGRENLEIPPNQPCATLQNGKSKSEWEIWKQEIWHLKVACVCLRMRHGQCRNLNPTLCKSPKWKVQNWKQEMGNLKAGNILKAGNVLESLRHGKCRNFKNKLSKMESPNLKAANGKSENRKNEIWKLHVYASESLRHGQCRNFNPTLSNSVQLSKMESPNLKAQEMQNLKAGNMKSESWNPQKDWDMENVENKPCATLQNGKSNFKLEMCITISETLRHGNHKPPGSKFEINRN